MRIFIQMSWRNLWRNKRRSLAVILTVAIGIFAMTLASGFINGFNAQMIENTINTSLGHIAIHQKGFQQDMKLEYNFKAGPSLYEAIKSTPGVIAYAPRVKIQGMLRSSEASRGVMIIGIDPEKETKVSEIYRYTQKEGGSRFLEDPAEDAILISATLAKKLDLVLGDRLVLMIQDQKGQIVGAGLKVVGLFVTPMASIDKHVAYVGIKKIQHLAGIGSNISEISIVCTDKNLAGPSAQSIISRSNASRLEILSWKDMAPHLARMIDLADNIVLFFFVIVFISVIFTIINTMIMTIMERFHEIGVMKSIGTRPARIFAMIVFESVNLSLVGLCAGAVLGVCLIFVLSQTGVDLSAYGKNLRNWGTGSTIYPFLKTKDIVSSSIIVIVIALISSLYPGLKAARINPLEALHFT
jgi:putative ABC transport system permease protein